MKPIFLKETVGPYQAGTYVWLYSTGYYDAVRKAHVRSTFVTSNRGSRHPGGTKIEPHQWEEPTTFVDVECRPVKVGDFICRFNTTDNIQVLERREVIAVTDKALMLAPKFQGGRITSTSDNAKVMIVNR